MRFFVRLSRKLRGPLEADQLVHLPGVDGHTLLCPERSDPKNRKNWRLARSFPELGALLGQSRGREKLEQAIARYKEDVVAPPAAPARPEEAAPGAASAGVWAALLAAAAGAALLLVWRTPQPWPRPAPPSVPKPAQALPWEAPARIVLPSCGKSLAAASGGGQRSFSVAGSGLYTLSWRSGTRPDAPQVLLEYDAGDREFRPLNDESRRLFEFGDGCRPRP